MPKGITIGRWDFPNKQAALNHCLAILYRDELSTKIVGEDAEFVEALFRAQVHKKSLRTRHGDIVFYREMHSYKCPCFFTLNDEHKQIQLNYKKAIALLAAE